MQVAREKITALLEQAIGLKASAIGVATLERAVNARMRATASRDIGTYLERLTGTFLEMRQLVEEVVVPETWFFRDQEPFTFLADRIVHSEKDLSREFFRILSLPCSTGEEPYSVAMTLLLAGLAPTSFFIDAVDVSERVLSRARQGVYRDNSFRSRDLSFRDIYFTQTPEGYLLQKTVRDKVRFLQGNIIQPGFMESLGRYDVVFCRNVLIYFSEEAQLQSIDSLHQALVPGGILFTGHAEASLFFNTKLFSVAHAKAFAFRRQSSSPAEVAWQKPWKEPLAPSSTTPPAARPRQKKALPPQPSQPLDRSQSPLALVRRLADEGQLDEAARQGEEHLRRQGPSAEWYCLLGVIRDSQGQGEEALKLLRKALYLEPDNIEGLVHLALMAERVGDRDGAANYRRRVRKIQERRQEKK